MIGDIRGGFGWEPIQKRRSGRTGRTLAVRRNGDAGKGKTEREKKGSKAPIPK